MKPPRPCNKSAHWVSLFCAARRSCRSRLKVLLLSRARTRRVCLLGRARVFRLDVVCLSVGLVRVSSSSAAGGSLRRLARQYFSDALISWRFPVYRKETNVQVHQAQWPLALLHTQDRPLVSPQACLGCPLECRLDSLAACPPGCLLLGEFHFSPSVIDAVPGCSLLAGLTMPIG
jgi:hypothetical protein